MPIGRILEKRENVTFHLSEITRIDLDARRGELDLRQTVASIATRHARF